MHRPRTGPAADLAALADTLVRVSHLAMHMLNHNALAFLRLASIRLMLRKLCNHS